MTHHLKIFYETYVCEIWHLTGTSKTWRQTQFSVTMCHGSLTHSVQPSELIASESVQPSELITSESVRTNVE